VDKINIVSSQAVLKMSCFSMDTRSTSSWPLVNSLVKNRLFKIAPDIDEPQFQIIHTMDLPVVDAMLHDSPDHVIHRMKTRAGWTQKSMTRFLTQFNCCTRALRGVPVHCPAGTQSRYQTLRIAGSSVTSLWCREAASKKSYHQNFLLCNNNEITCIADLFNSFVKECMRLHFSR